MTEQDIETRVQQARAQYDEMAASLVGPPQEFPEAAFRAMLTRTAAPEPSWWQRTANFAGAVASHVASGLPQASPELIAARLAICRACDQYNSGSCRLCGCNLAWKASWAEQVCPVGKWPPIAPDPPSNSGSDS